MCLYKKSRVPRIAMRDITVYKIVITKNHKYVTLFRNYEIELGKTYKGIFYGDNIIIELILSLLYHAIFDGYIHSYCKLEKWMFKPHHTIMKCVIPRGTLYFIGDDNDIASRKLKYIEVIKEI